MPWPLTPPGPNFLRKLYSDYQEARIEEYDTEDDTKKISQKCTSVWVIHITKTGEVSSVEERWHFGDGQYENQFYFPFWENGGFCARVCNDSRNVAIKIALDTRAKMLAEKLGL